MSDVAAIILAGGRSARMGEDKAFLRLGRSTLIEVLSSKLEADFSEIIIAADLVKKYNNFKTRVVADIIPARGPLGGIYTGLVNSGSRFGFVFACDMPFVNLDFVRYMKGQIDGADIVVPKRNQRYEPLHAIYSKRCIQPIKDQIERDDLKISNLFSRLEVRVIGQEVIDRFDPKHVIFTNINTEEDYERVKITLGV